MDIGIDRLIEMFEQRFGRPAATILLALIGLAAAGFAIRLIVLDIVEPGWHAGVAVYAWLHAIPIKLPAFTVPKWTVLGERLYGVAAVFFAVFVAEQIWVRVFRRTQPLLPLLSPSAFHLLSDLKQENAALRRELQELRNQGGD